MRQRSAGKPTRENRCGGAGRGEPAPKTFAAVSLAFSIAGKKAVMVLGTRSHTFAAHWPEVFAVAGGEARELLTGFDEDLHAACSARVASLAMVRKRAFAVREAGFRVFPAYRY